MGKKVMIMFIGLVFIVGLPVMALCQDEITESTAVEEETAVIEAALEDTGPPFLEEIYAAIDAEAAARGTADAALQAGIVSEETARIAEDTLLWDAINNWMSLLDDEAITRASADADLQNQIDDILGPSSPPPGVSFGKLVVERNIESTIQPDLFANFVKDWLGGIVTPASALLTYKSFVHVVREVEFLGLRPTYYSTSRKEISIQPFTIQVEHIEFSVENVEIGFGNFNEYASLQSFEFRFDGDELNGIVSVKPPEIYFGQPEVTQVFDSIPVIAPYGDLLEDVISRCGLGEDYWQNISGAGINVTQGGAAGEDVVLAGDVTARWIVDDWVKLWIEDFDNALPEDIAIMYTHFPGEGGRFNDAVPTSYILPIVSVDPLEIQGKMERLSFTYSSVTE